MAKPEIHLTAAVTQEDDLYVARCLEVEVTSQGETFESSMQNLMEALLLYFEDMPLPEVTKAPIIAPIAIPA